MTDIVERLRSASELAMNRAILLECADEITRLRAELAAAREREAGAWLAAAERAYLWWDDDDAQDLREHVRGGTPAASTAALEARDARVRAEERAKVIEEAARILDADADEATSWASAEVDGSNDQIDLLYDAKRMRAFAGKIRALHTDDSRKAGGK